MPQGKHGHHRRGAYHYRWNVSKIIGSKKLTEKLFQARVEQALKVAGWRVYHTWNSMHSTAGFPDLVAIHPKRKEIRVIEVKSDTGGVKPEQTEWLEAFAVCGIKAEVLRPAGFDEFWESVIRG